MQKPSDGLRISGPGDSNFRPGSHLGLLASGGLVGRIALVLGQELESVQIRCDHP